MNIKHERAMSYLRQLANSGGPMIFGHYKLAMAIESDPDGASEIEKMALRNEAVFLRYDYAARHFGLSTQ